MERFLHGNTPRDTLISLSEKNILGLGALLSVLVLCIRDPEIFIRKEIKF